jgi:hypothetical protein
MTCCRSRTLRPRGDSGHGRDHAQGSTSARMTSGRTPTWGVGVSARAARSTPGTRACLPTSASQLSSGACRRLVRRPRASQGKRRQSEVRERTDDGQVGSIRLSASISCTGFVSAGAPPPAQPRLHLAALGAPASLVELAHLAALDEIRHARRCFALASAYAGRVWTPGPIAGLAGRLLLVGRLDLGGRRRLDLGGWRRS